MTGWITTFFPYREQFEFNCYLSWHESYEATRTVGLGTAVTVAVSHRKEWMHSVQISQIPSGITTAFVTMDWRNGNPCQNLKFLAGILTIHQHSNGALEPRTGWAVVIPK
jgi:hypothetical protein